MADYVIFTDSACDMHGEVLRKWGVSYRSLTFAYEGETKEYTDDDMEPDEFFRRMKDGAVSHTSAVNTETFREAFEEVLSEGKDVLYIGFSSGLSTTSNSGIMAAEELREKYPDRKLIALDTLTASGGEGLLVYLSVQKKAEGASLEENAEYVKKTAPKIGHWFTVEDLVYLKRGGRLSATAYFAATVLNIKPVMHVDDEGKLTAIKKVRGRKKSLDALLDAYDRLAVDKTAVYTICHGACAEDAQYLADTIRKKYGAEAIITEMGPVIGSHAGPGVMLLSFVATER